MRLYEFQNVNHVRQILGPVLTKAVDTIQKQEKTKFTSTKFARKPWMISFHTVKPTFTLHDFETMMVYAVNLSTSEISHGVYCGSGLSTINHMGLQLSEGESIPEGFALVFFRKSGGNSWALDIVISQSQIEARKCLAIEQK